MIPACLGNVEDIWKWFMIVRVFGVLICLSIVLMATSAQAADAAAYSDFFKKHCNDCHGGGTAEGGLSLDKLKYDLADRKNYAVWERVHDRIQLGEMPPKDMTQPTADEKNGLLGTLGTDLLVSHEKRKGTVLRRLNRIEYENTLRDLLGIDVSVKEMLPEDSIFNNLDNIGEALGMSDVQLEQYIAASSKSLDDLFTRTNRPEQQTLDVYLEDPKKPTPLDYDLKKLDRTLFFVMMREDGTQIIFHTADSVHALRTAGVNKEGKSYTSEWRAPEDGDYRLTMDAYAYQSPAPMNFSIMHGPNMNSSATSGEMLGFYQVKDQSQKYDVTMRLRKGDKVRIYPELYYRYTEMINVGPYAYKGHGMAINNMKLEGPLKVDWPPRGQKLLIGNLPTKVVKQGGKDVIVVGSNRPEADAVERLVAFATAAFRRDVTIAEIRPYLLLFKQAIDGDADFSTAIKIAATGILTAPQHLYLIEPDGKLDHFQVASRLSYMFWRSMPDDELLDLARKGKLHDKATLRKQVSRLLDDPRSNRFHNDFLDAWLRLREIDFTSPDSNMYPEYDLSLRYSMLEETRAFWKELVNKNLPTTNIADSDFAMVNARLAEHYDLPKMDGMELRSVKLPPKNIRGGILTQASVLKVSANGTNTSPVVRGAYVLDCILGTPPPPPPPGIPGVEPDTRGASTLRQILDKHRNDQSCNSCHSVIDPPGFALENFDVIGGWRDKFRTTGDKAEKKSLQVNGHTVHLKFGLPVDCSGHLRSGKDFRNYTEFKQLLKAEVPRMTLALTNRLLMFGTGRELGFSDRPETYTIVSNNISKKQGIRDLIMDVVTSEIFLNK